MSLLKARKYIKEVLIETKRVTWPTRPDVITSSIIAFILCTFFALFLFFVDQIVVVCLKNLFNVS